MVYSKVYLLYLVNLLIKLQFGMDMKVQKKNGFRKQSVVELFKKLTMLVKLVR